jgi:hypothetical protein
MATQTQTSPSVLDATPSSLTRNTSLDTPPPDIAAIDAHAEKGWVFFTKFLFWTVISIVVILVAIGLLTVWR